MLAYALVATAALYVGLAFASDNVKAWFGIEMTGFAIFGSFGLLGLVGSPWWLVVGFALHPLWHRAVPLSRHRLGVHAGLVRARPLRLRRRRRAYLLVAILGGPTPPCSARRPAAPEERLNRNERRLSKKS